MRSDKSEVELVPGGRDISVTYATRREFVDAVYKARLNEHMPQIEAIQKGIAKIIPIQLLNLLTWEELEVAVSGSKVIDIDLLKRHTKYARGVNPDDNHIKWFWEVLREYDNENRRKFIKFAWAQERLPSSTEEFVRSHTRFMIKPVSIETDDEDRLLPKADTCFFNLELPAYSCKEILSKKLLFAITETVTMNADEPNEDDEQRHDFHDRDEYSDEEE